MLLIVQVLLFLKSLLCSFYCPGQSWIEPSIRFFIGWEWNPLSSQTRYDASFKTQMLTLLMKERHLTLSCLDPLLRLYILGSLSLLISACCSGIPFLLATRNPGSSGVSSNLNSLCAVFSINHRLISLKLVGFLRHVGL